jgi:Nif-specific regulatory protein
MLKGHEVHLRDLGSRNATLVNGELVKDALLKPGDEILIGEIVLAVSDTEDTGSVGGRVSAHTTLSLAEGNALYLQDDESIHPRDQDFHALRNVVQLFRAGRDLSRATSIDELVRTLAKTIQEHFRPEAYWFAWVRAEGTASRIELVESVSSLTPPPETAMQQTAQERRGFLVPERLSSADGGILLLTLVAPVHYGDHSIAVAALQSRTSHRAYDETDLHYLVSLAHTVAPFFDALEHRQNLEREVASLRMGREKAAVLIGTGKVMQDLREQIAKAARSVQPILLVGETGTGKELAARLIHELSERATGPLVTVNCAAIPHDLFESELFGYEKGAFTGATMRKPGFLEQSHGGTLFLDEVCDLSPENQARILRAVETKQFRPVGARRDARADFRVVSATNKDVEDTVSEGSFRRDLYHRLRGIEIRVRPLREHKGDIPELAQHFFEEARAHAKRPLRGFAPDAVEFLTAQRWPGNVRELRNCIEAAASMTRHEVITVEDLRASASGSPAEPPLTLAEVEMRHIRAVLDSCNGHVVEAAKILGIGKTTLYAKLAQLEDR